MTSQEARALLGIGPLATSRDVRRAFGEAARRAHPDRAGGDDERFRAVVNAYRRLRDAQGPEPAGQPPAPRDEPPGVLAIEPLVALCGGSATYRRSDGRVLRIRLPAGVRTGDTVRAGALFLTAAIVIDAAMMVRGDDLWIGASVDPRTLAEGGRIALETPLGRRIVWVTRKAGERGLVRIVGQGLPARGSHPQGHLFVRLAARPGRADSAARTLLRRFTAAWAA